MTITINDMSSSGRLTLEIDGVISKLQDTKKTQIYNDYYFSMLEYNYKGESSASYAVLNITPLELESNQYVMRKDVTITLNDIELTLKESKSDDYIKVLGCQMDVFCQDQTTIQKTETEDILGLQITNRQNYYLFEQYALVEITS